MRRKSSIGSLKSKSFQSPDLRDQGTERDRVWSRQEGIPNWNQQTAWDTTVLQVGCGGLGGEILHSLVKKGYGEIHCFDGDTVDLSNLNRQRFTAKDLCKNKAARLARNLAQDGCMGSRISAYPYYFEAAQERGLDLTPDVVICGVDSDQSRRAVAEWAMRKHVPALFCAVSRDGDQCYCLVQRPGEACFGCILPHAINIDITPCPGVPAIIDPLKLASALTSFAVDSLVMGRPIGWNYREIRLAGFMPELVRTVPRNPECPLCGENREGQS